MDAFFASVEQREHPEYRNQPLIIGGLSGRGVVSTCSYEARKYGVHSAMPMERAKRLCPQGIFIQGSFPLYKEASQEVFSIFHAFSPVVEPLSIDEAFLDMTGMERLAKSPHDYAVRLKTAIREKTQLVASIGIAPNKFLAKIASDLEKPDGLVEVPADEAGIRAFLWPLPVSRIWGVGKKTEARLHLLHVQTVGDLAKLAPLKLRQNFGEKTAQQLRALSLGHDDRPVAPRGPQKSIGREITYPEDLRDNEVIKRQLRHLAEEVGWRLRRAGRKARTITLKCRRGDFHTWTRSKTLDRPTHFDDEIYETAKQLYHDLHPAGGIRLLGISGSNFDEAEELALFGEETDEKKERLYDTVDTLKKRFGKDIISSAAPLIEGGGPRERRGESPVRKNK